MTTALYHYDQAGFLRGTSIAEMSPEEPNVPMVPFMATLLEPPAPGAGQAARFDGEAWVLEAVSLPAAAEPEGTGAMSLDTLVQLHLDDSARSMGYRGIDSAVTYADEPAVLKFQREGQSLRAWRSLVWAAYFEIKAAVVAGDRDEPTGEQLLQELPAFELLPESVE